MALIGIKLATIGFLVQVAAGQSLLPVVIYAAL